MIVKYYELINLEVGCVFSGGFIGCPSVGVECLVVKFGALGRSLTFPRLDGLFRSGWLLVSLDCAANDTGLEQ